MGGTSSVLSSIIQPKDDDLEMPCRTDVLDCLECLVSRTQRLANELMEISDKSHHGLSELKQAYGELMMSSKLLDNYINAIKDETVKIDEQNLNVLGNIRLKLESQIEDAKQLKTKYGG